MLKIKEIIEDCCCPMLENTFRDGFFILRTVWGKPGLCIRGKKAGVALTQLITIYNCPFCGEKL